MYYHIFTAWNKDWKPGPYPVTQEERAAAARKYGLRLEDYEPYPDDGTGYGDYPKLPVVSAESRDPYINWDHPEHRRNFGEPVRESCTIDCSDWKCKKWLRKLLSPFEMVYIHVAKLFLSL